MIATSVAYAPNGQYLATGSWDGTVKLWNASNGEIERTLTGHQYAVNAVAFSSDGKTLASAAGLPAMRESPETPGEVILWNTATGERLHTLPAFEHPVSAIAFSPDGQTLATVSYRVDAQPKSVSIGQSAIKKVSVIQLWDLVTWRVRQTITIDGGSAGPIAFSPDGHYLAIGTTVLTGTKTTKGKGFTSTETITAAEILLYDPVTASLQHKMVVASSSLQSLAFSSNGQILAAGYGLEGDDNYGPIRLWDVDSGKMQKMLQTGKNTDWGNVAALAFSPDGKTLAAIKSALGDFIQIWNVDTGKVENRLSEVNQKVGMFGQLVSLAFSPDGHSMAVSGGYIDYGLVQLWNMNSDQVQWSNTSSMFRMSPIAITNDGKTLGCNFNQLADSTTQLWNAQSGRLKLSIPNPSFDLASLAFSPDNKWVGTGGTVDLKKAPYIQGSLKIWSVADGHLMREFKPERGVSSFAFTPDSSRVVIGDSFIASLWDVKTGKDLHNYKPNLQVGDSVAVSPDGKMIAGVGGDEHSQEWGELMVWDTGSGKILGARNSDKFYIGTVAFSPSGQIIATGHSDGSIGLWDAHNGNLIRIFTGHKGGVTQVAFSSDGQSLVSSGADGAVKKWDVATGKLKSTLEVGSPIWDFSLAPGGRLWTSNNDNLLQAWNISSGQLLVTIEVLSCERNAKGYLTTDWIARTPDGYYETSPGGERYIRWRDGNTLLPAAAYEKIYHRPDLVEAALRTE